MLDKVVIIFYMLVLFTGAFLGYLKGSMISVGMGTGSGLMMLVGLWLLKLNPKGCWVFLSSLAIFLMFSFLLRVLKSQVFYPSGVLLILTILFLTYCANKIRLINASK